MSLTVVILNWNGRTHLETCLDSLVQQTRPADQIIVVDNHSTRDDSVAFLRSRYPEIKCIELQENLGFAGGNNAALPYVTGDRVMLLNNDTSLEPDCLERLLECMPDDPHVGMVAAHLVDWERNLTDSAGDGCRVTGRGFGRHRRHPAASAPGTGPVFGACAGAALYRRELIEDVGFLDDDFFLNFEDTDLSFRARLRGWEVWFCREAVVRHRISASQGAWSPTNAYYGARNHLWVCAKNMPLWLLVKYAPLTLLQTAVLGMVAIRHRCGIAYIRGLAAGLSGLPRMVRKRRGIMARRTIALRQLESWLTPLNLSMGALHRLFRSR